MSLSHIADGLYLNNDYDETRTVDTLVSTIDASSINTQSLEYITIGRECLMCQRDGHVYYKFEDQLTSNEETILEGIAIPE